MLQEVKMKSCISPPPQREFTQAEEVEGGGGRRVGIGTVAGTGTGTKQQRKQQQQQTAKHMRNFV